ncbi:unnamed protein product [Medioppia subpectinata]|uniref:Peptidase S1 domain-containing protein n=1 Tax=Medioppia subpectinata TaxID=1979941 RepID=A0A7R9KLC3_9ACAR|nr:unnamed protein product [Medioppia subpectinata]CAG2105379.1 unnamed protein product [Medioppia subpectinata]
MSCGPKCKATNIRVYPGLTNQSYTNHTYYTGGQYFIYPEYERNQYIPWDLALIRLNTAIPLDGTSGSSGINAICLPEEMALNAGEEYALLNGFGTDNSNGTGSGIQRIGWTKIMKSKYDPNNTFQRNYVLYAKRIPFPSGSATCSGDSGSPYVQYVNGLAVLIGIHSSTDKNPGESCLKVTEHSKLNAVRITI